MKLPLIAALATVTLTGLAPGLVAPAAAQHRMDRHHHRPICHMEFHHHHRVRVCR